MTIPELQVDIINKSVKANGEDVPIYIDGHPASAQEVAALHPNEIYRVEYNKHPQGEFTGVKTLINIITRSPDRGGLLMGGLTQKEEIFGEYYLYYKVYRKKTQFMLALEEEYKHDKSTSVQVNQFTNPTDNSQIVRRNVSDEPIRDKTSKVGFFYSYKQDSLSSKLSFTFTRPKSPWTTSSGYRFQEGSPLITTLSSCESSLSNSPSLDWNFTKTWRKGNTLRTFIAYLYSKNKYNSLKEETESNASSPSFLWVNNADEDFHKINYSVNYSLGSNKKCKRIPLPNAFGAQRKRRWGGERQRIVSA